MAQMPGGDNFRSEKKKKKEKKKGKVEDKKQEKQEDEGKRREPVHEEMVEGDHFRGKRG